MFKKVIITICTLTMSLFLFSTQVSAHPATGIVSNETGGNSISLRRSFLDLSQTLEFDDSVKLKVIYTYNDGTGVISGIKKVTNVSRSPLISNVSWTYKRGLSNSYYVFTVTYYKEGSGYKTSLRYLYPDLS